MNSRIFTLTTLLLFFVVKISAQTPVVPTSNIPISNQLDFTILVEGERGQQQISLLADDMYYVLPHNDLFFNLELAYLPDSDNVTFFRLRCDFSPSGFGEPIDPAFFGITNPVIIPPVRKKNGGSVEPQSFTDRPIGIYPYKVKAEYVIRPTIYRATVELLKYETFADYINNSPNFTIGPTATFIIHAQNTPTPVMESTTTNSFSVLTFPNPSTNHVTFEYTREATENAISQQLPFGVTIFNDKGVQLSQHTLTSTNVKPNSTSYNLDTSHLQKGTYYFQLSHGSKTQVKTIIKE